MEETTWSLGTVRNTTGERREFEFLSVRDLTETEFAGLVNDMGLLRSLSGHNLIAALVDKLNAVVQIEVQMHESPHSIQDGQFRYQMVSAVNAYLGEFTAFRSRVETLADEYLPDYSKRIRNIFGQFHDDNAHYRLAWELRNASQHGAGATRHFKLSTFEGGRHWVIDLSALFADHENEKRWQAASRLWDGTNVANVMVVLRGAYEASNQALAVLLVENESALEGVIDRIAQATVEAISRDHGHPIAWATTGVSETTMSISQLSLDSVDIGYAVGSLRGARQVLGLPPSPRFEYDAEEPSET